jgi:CheY-like chemotaxis protein
LKAFRYRILVVDDDEQIRRAFGDLFCHFGYEVRTAGDGFEALALMRGALPDLIISDLNMSPMSGFEFMFIVRRRFPHIPVVCITGAFIGAPDPEGLFCDAFFHKSQYRPPELFNEIHSLIQQSPIRPHIPKLDQSPVWIPCDAASYILTCTECLRCSPMLKDEPEGIVRERLCVYCGARIRFILHFADRKPSICAKPPRSVKEDPDDSAKLA